MSQVQVLYRAPTFLSISLSYFINNKSNQETGMRSKTPLAAFAVLLEHSLDMLDATSSSHLSGTKYVP